MALIKCEDCKNEYSDKAKECPKCGCPTVNNTISKKRNNIKECSVKINGDETIEPKITKNIFILIISFIIIFFTAGILDLRTILGQKDLMVFLMFLFIFCTFTITYWVELCPSVKEQRKNIKVINEYFKKRFMILDIMPHNYLKTELINKTNKTNEATMFDIYMEAYKFNADTIVINDSNVTTHVSGYTTKGGRGSTSSSNKFHITATLVRY